MAMPGNTASRTGPNLLVAGLAGGVVVCLILIILLSQNSEQVSFAMFSGWDVTQESKDAQALMAKELEELKLSEADATGRAESYRKQVDDLRRTTIAISDLPREIQGGTAAEVRAKVQKLTEVVSTPVSADSGSSFAIISQIVAAGSIDTKLPSDKFPQRRLVYIALQNCLQSIGAYMGPLDGSQASTHKAVTAFQTVSKLTADGVVGKKTWAAIMAKKSPSASNQSGSGADKSATTPPTGTGSRPSGNGG